MCVYAFQVHAEIEYRSSGPEDHHYFIRDVGSNNGTFVNSVRLSEARQTSSEVEVRESLQTHPHTLHQIRWLMIYTICFCCP